MKGHDDPVAVPVEAHNRSMGYRYCPSCGAEYHADITACSDCLVPLVDQEPGERGSEQVGAPDLKPLVEVLVTGRQSEAELARSFLEAHEIETHIWSSGLSPWRMEAALTEVTGLASDFNAHRVMVSRSDAERARELLDRTALEHQEKTSADADGGGSSGSSRTWMETFRTRWIVVTFAIVLLVIVLVFGPPPPE